MKEVFSLCGISRQAHFQMLQRQWHCQQQAALYVGLIEQTREMHPGMGLRTMYEMLQPQGIGRDSFMALGAAEGYQLQSVERQTRTTFSIKTNRYGNLLGGKEFTGTNQLWSSDITYFHCLGQFFYIVFIMDVYSRRILGYSVADNMRAEHNVTALQMALKARGIKNYEGRLIHHSDKGGQYASDAYTDLLENYGIQISMCNEVYENTHIERVNGTIKNQYLQRWAVGSKKQLGQRLQQAVKAYNETRPHESIRKMPPLSYEQILESIPKEKRVKMTIYTVSKYQDNFNSGQLNLFQQLS
jgi:transposase InsO family protein